MTDNQLCMFSTPVMPQEYIGKEKTSGGITKNTPREWTDKEVEWCLNLKAQGYTTREIAESVCRDITSVSVKMKRLSKANDTYNAKHLEEKYRLNADFFNAIQPKTILDVYSGEKHYWSDKAKCVSNDKNTNFEATYHLDAFDLMCQEYAQKHKYDLVDLDPFGSAFDCFDIATKIANKGLIITYGELGHLRWKRIDYVKYTYGIERIEDFTLDRLIAETQKIGRHNHKELSVHSYGEWQGIARVYYTICPFKNYEAWEAKNE